MAKRSGKKFRNKYANQTKLGLQFGLSAIAIGKKLIELGLRNKDKSPTKRALKEDYCVKTPLKNGIVFYMWNKRKVIPLLKGLGLEQFNKHDIEALTLAKELINEAKAAERSGFYKFFYLTLDYIPKYLTIKVDKDLCLLGSEIRVAQTSALEMLADMAKELEK